MLIIIYDLMSSSIIHLLSSYHRQKKLKKKLNKLKNPADDPTCIDMSEKKKSPRFKKFVGASDLDAIALSKTPINRRRKQKNWTKVLSHILSSMFLIYVFFNYMSCVFLCFVIYVQSIVYVIGNLFTMFTVFNLHKLCNLQYIFVIYVYIWVCNLYNFYNLSNFGVVQ